MKLINLMPLREYAQEEQLTPELTAIPYFREFQAIHGYKPLFKFLGVKNEENIFVADLKKCMAAIQYCACTASSTLNAPEILIAFALLF